MSSGAGASTTTAPQAASAPVRIAVSACLLGEKVRYDGGHKRDGFLLDVLGPWVEFVSVCPEVAIGLGTPRPTIRLERRGDEVALVEPKSGADYTARMSAYAGCRARELSRLDLCGYVLKSRSPSCGMERVPVINAKGMPQRNGRGVYARALMQALPVLPVEEEGRLCDARLRENFVERVFAYRRLKDFFAGCWSVGGLIRFHTAHKLQLMSHSPVDYRALGALVAGAQGMERIALRDAYQVAFMAALRRTATPGQNTNVMQHMAGYFKRQLDSGCRQELMELIEDFRQGLVPQIVPLTLLRHHAYRLGVDYLIGQTYLQPHPKELMLRNHV